VLTAATMNAHNSFEISDRVKTAEFSAFRVSGDGFAATLPAESVVVLAAEQGAACSVHRVWHLLNSLAIRPKPGVSYE
jgi:hypothetical protein